MAEPQTFKAQSDAVKLRQNPRPITRVNRKVLMTATAIGLTLLLAGMAVAFSPAERSSPAPAKEIFARRTHLPEGLANMPASYDAVKPDIPKLGEPLPGEFGAAILKAETERKSVPYIPNRASEPYQSTPDIEAARAERLRQAGLQSKANEASVFFQLSQKPAQPIRPAPAHYVPPNPHLALGQGNIMPSANNQAGKSAFAALPPNSTFNSNRLEMPRSAYQLMAGSIIPASLITGVNSDLPGTVIAQVTQNVFDTVSGNHLLVPQGARLIGRYDSGVTFGQERALLVWDRLILPNGRSVSLNALPGADAMGRAGLKDRTDHHWGRVTTAAVLATFLGIGSELASDDDADDVARAIRDAFQDTAGRAGDAIVQRQLGIQPTIRIRPGARVQIMVTQDLNLQTYQTGAN